MMQPNNNYFSDFYGSTSSAFNNNNSAHFHVDNMPGPSQYLNNNNSTIAHNNAQATQSIDELRSVNEILPRYRSVFASYPCFNIIQSRVLDVVLYSDESVVVSAPTGSGKTAIFELAIVRFLTSLESFGQQIPYKIVYVAPMKALCEERLIDWHRKFASLGLTCLLVTGDSDNIDFQTLLSHNLIITTPEKWDSLTRKWRDNTTLATLVKLFMIDEVHLVSEDHRGPTLEAVVCRMKAIQDLILTNDSGMPFSMKMRFVAVSATIPNAEDIAEWLSIPTVPARTFKFGDEMRPVKLKKVVFGYPYSSQTSTPFKFDIMLSYKLQSIMLQYAEGKPTLIFCSTRKSVEITSKQLIQNLTINLNPPQRQILQAATSSVSDSKIKEMLVNGVCYHHAGLAPEDRKIVEELFRNANLPILVTTSTLAMGVNLPAHLVIIKSTKYYSNGEYRDYSETMLLQMIGRAGRPQFDTSATAVILTTTNDKKKYENMVGREQSVESNLHKHLTEHLNAEVVLHTITDLGVAMQWLTSTFLHIRARKNPRYYGLPLELTPDQIDKKLLDMCQIEINRLARADMLTIDQDDIRISPTSTGSLMAKYCIAFGTMRLFAEVTGKEILQQVLGLISKCQEFSEIYLRVNDKKALNLLNKCRNRETIRFPFNGKIKTVDMKINCIIQAVFGCLQILEQSLVTESQKIMRIGERISKCLAEYLETKGNCYSALLSALVLAKCFHARLWEISPFVSKQLSGIGSVFSSALVTAGKTTFKSLLEANPRDIERIVNRKSPMGNTIQDQVAHLPDYELILEEVLGEERFSVHLKVCLKNFLLLRTSASVTSKSLMILLVGDTNNNMFLYEKFTHGQLIENPQVVKKFEFPTSYVHEIKAHFISEDWVGFDCNVSLLPSSAKKNKENVVNMNKNKGPVEKHIKAVPSKQPSHIQTFMDTYFKNSKAKNQKQKQVHTSRALVNPRKSDINKENSANIPNVLNTPQPLEEFPKFDNNIENTVDISTTNMFQKEVDEHPVERQPLETMFTKQTEERYLRCQNETNSEIIPKSQAFQELIHDSIQEYKKQNEYKLPKLQESSESLRGYYLPASITKHTTAETDPCSASLVRSDNYSATARRNLEFTQERRSLESDNKNGAFKPLFGYSHQTRISKKKPNCRLTKNMNCTVNFVDSLYDPSLETDNNNRQNDSIVLKFKYTPSKKYNHDIIASQIKQEELNTSADNEQHGSSDTINLADTRETPKYEIKELRGINLKNAGEASKSVDGSLRSGDNFQKTLTWRSPLVSSPAVRYSPILHNEESMKGRKEENISFSSLNSIDIATPSHGNKPRLKFSISVNNDSSETSTSLSETNVLRPTLRQNMFKKSGALALSDQAHSQSYSQIQLLNTEPCSSSSRYHIQTEDALLSTTLLEDLGLIQKTSPAKENSVVGISSTQTNFEGNQVKKVAKMEKVIKEGDYYSKLLLDASGKRAERHEVAEPPIFENNENEKTELNVQFQSPLVSRGNSIHQQPTNSQSINASKQNISDVSLGDFDIGNSFIFERFSPQIKKSDNKPVNSTTASHFNPNILDFSNSQNLFTAKTSREQNINNSQLGEPKQARYVTSYDQHPTSEFGLATSHAPRFSRVMSENSQQNPTRKRLARYAPKVFPTQRSSNEFQGFRTGSCQCADSLVHVSNPIQELRFQPENRNRHTYHNHHQPISSPMYDLKDSSITQHHGTSRCCPRVPMTQPIERNDFYDRPQAETSASHGCCNAMGCNNCGYNIRGNLKRQKLQNYYRTPSTSRSYSFQDRDDFCTMKPRYYSQYENIPQTYIPTSDYLHRCKNSYPPLIEYETTYAPIYNHDDKQFMLQRYLNSVDQKQLPKTSIRKTPHCFSQAPLDFPICTDGMEDQQDEDDDFSLN